jgi:hypothetical protein
MTRFNGSDIKLDGMDMGMEEVVGDNGREGQELANLNRAQLEEKMEELGEISQAISDLEQDLALMGANLTEMNRGGRMPHPHVSIESLTEAIKTRVTDCLEGLLNSCTLTVNSLYRMEVLKLRAVLLEEKLAV